MGIVSQYAYVYDGNGNRRSQIETNAGRTETTTYAYDPVNRLETVTYAADGAFPNGRVVSYSYDLAGNRKTEVETDPITSGTFKDLTYDYDAINRLDTITDNLDVTQNVTYQYDSNGNTLSKTKNGVTADFLYDIRNQLGEVRQDASILGRYGYDSKGLRILKIGDDGIWRYTYDQLSVITEANESNTTVSKYDLGMDQLVRLDNTVEGRSFFHLDILGSTASLSDGVGATRQSIFYDAWGNERDRAGLSANKFTFTGHEKDAETGLIYARARFYDPDVGRFLTQDGLLGAIDQPPSPHRYAYVKQNPLLFVDPTGNLDVKSFLRGGFNVFAEPFRQSADVLVVLGSNLFEIDSQHVELSSALGQAQKERVESGQGIAEASAKGVGEVVFAIGTAATGPFVQGQIELALALDRGQITIDEYEQGLSELAGGATAFAVLGSLAAKSQGKTFRGRLKAEVVVEKGVPNRLSEGAVEPAKSSSQPRQLALPFEEGPIGKAAPKQFPLPFQEGPVGKAVPSPEGETTATDLAPKAKTSPTQKRPSKRLQYVGKTPRKTSPTGRAVIERMRNEGRIAQGEDGSTWVRSSKSGRWVKLEETEMGHLEDAVKYWNRDGYKLGPKSKAVRQWMKDPDNYELQPKSENRSQGGELRDRVQSTGDEKLTDELADDVHKKLTELCSAGDELVEQGTYDAALQKYREGLLLLPEPYEKWDASTWILTAIGETLFFAGDFADARDTLQDAMRCPDAIGNPLIHLRLGQAQYELGNDTRARDELSRAYMGTGDEIFENEDPKYLALVKSILRPDDNL